MPGGIRPYLSELRTEFGYGNTTEHSFRTALKNLLESFDSSIHATNEPRRRTDCGAPDMAIYRNGLTIGYLEAKDLDVNLAEAERSEQIKRYLRSLPNLILTNQLEFRWYVDGRLRQSTVLGRLDGNTIQTLQSGQEETQQVLNEFLGQRPEPIVSPEDLATRMARITHMIHDIVLLTFRRGEASNLFKDLHRSFQKVLLPELTQDEFADMFAQTLAYGLFAARINHNSRTGPFGRYRAAAEIPRTNPFLRRFFDTITGVEMDDEPFAGFVEDLTQLLTMADMSEILRDFGVRTKREDPVVHFYETFLTAYDPELREVRGVYYTPEPIITYIIRSVDYLLRERFDCSRGLADDRTVTFDRTIETESGKSTVTEQAPKVLVLDPATGTGSFLYAVIDQVREQFMAEGNAGLWSGYVKRHLLPRLFGFELLMAPYAVAHLKLGMQLAGQDLDPVLREQWSYDFSGDDRLGVYLTNSLEKSKATRHQTSYLERYIAEEANAADRVKRDLPVLVILGNPPYSGHSANRSWENHGGKQVRTFIGELLDDYYFVDGKRLDERNPKWLQDDYVKFIRWSQWRIDQTGAGVLAFITNHGYLDNPTFRGMRQHLMKTFDEIYLVDLHGNAKKQRRSPDGGPNENVFDIQQGVSVGVFVKSPERDGGDCDVYHIDVWGTRQEKYDWLNESLVENGDWNKLEPESPFYLFVPLDTERLKEYQQGWSIPKIFTTHSVGIATGRDRFVIDFDDVTLTRRLASFVDSQISDEDARRRFLSQKDSLNVNRARKQLRTTPSWRQCVSKILYRPFDYRFVCYHDAIIERTRSNVMRHLQYQPNLALITSRLTKGEVFAHTQVTRRIAEVICMSPRTSNNGFVFPLYTYPDAETETRA
jgi:predicted helicase